MTSPKLAGATQYGRMYGRTRGGNLEVPSITTVLDVLNQHMEWWEARCAVDAAWDWAHRIVEIKQTGDDWRTERKAKDWMRAAAERDRNGSAARGDFVHDYAETWALMTIGQATQEDLDYHRALCEDNGAGAYLAHFHQFWEDWQPTVIMPEATVWNSTVGYAGTTDLLFQVEAQGRTVNIVGDYKTKKSLFKRNGEPKDVDLRDYTGMQLAAAAFAEEMWVPGAAEDGSQDAWKPMDFGAEVGVGIAIAPDGYVVRQYAIHYEPMFEAFKALRQAWNFYQHGPRMMSPKLAGPDQMLLPNRANAEVAI